MNGLNFYGPTWIGPESELDNENGWLQYYANLIFNIQNELFQITARIALINLLFPGH